MLGAAQSWRFKRHLPPPWDANLEVRNYAREGGYECECACTCVRACVNCLILAGSKALFPSPALRKIRCAHFKRKEMAISVKDMTNVCLSKCSTAGVFCCLIEWHSMLKIPKTANTRDQYVRCVHYSGNINAYISPGRGKNDLARLEFPKAVVNPNGPVLPLSNFITGICNGYIQSKDEKVETPAKSTIRDF